MIKKSAFFVLLAALIATSAYAVPSRVGKWDAGVNVSGFIPEEGDTTAYVGGSASYGVNEWLGLGVSSGWAQFDDSDAGVTVEQTSVPLFGDIILRVPMQQDQQYQPYAVIGLGVMFSDSDVNVSNVDVSVDDAFAAKFGGGVDWFVNDNWILNFEFSYITSDADGTVRNTATGATVGVSGSNDSWMVGGGLKYLFS